MNTAPDESGPSYIPSYDEILAFDPDEFVTAFRWAMNADSGTARRTCPPTTRFSLTAEDGCRRERRAHEGLENRVMAATLERYGPTDHLRYHSALARIFALLDMAREGGLEPWIRTTDGSRGDLLIAESVVEAAAVVPLNEELQFPVLEFMQKVREIEAGWEA